MDMNDATRTPPPLPRKKHHCRSCGSPMAGHKRPSPGQLVCPSSPGVANGMKPESQQHNHNTQHLAPQTASPHSPSILKTPPQQGLNPTCAPTPHYVTSDSSLEGPAQISYPTPPPAVNGGRASMTPYRVSPRSSPLGREHNWGWERPPVDQPKETSDILEASLALMVPTVLVGDDGRTISMLSGGDDVAEEDGEEDRYEEYQTLSTSPTFIDTLAQDLNILGGGKSKDKGKGKAGTKNVRGGKSRGGRQVVTMFSTNRTDVGKTQQMLAKAGMFAGLVKIPSHRSPPSGEQGEAEVGKKKSGRTTYQRVKKALTREGSWWMVVGKDPAAVGRVVAGAEAHAFTLHAPDPSESEKEGERMPGTVGDLVMEGPRIVTIPQLVFAGTVAAIVTVFLLSTI